MNRLLATSGLVLLSMGIGAGAVAVANQIQDIERRDTLTSGLERRAELARQRLALAAAQLQAVDRQIAVGIANQEQRLERRVEVAEAEAEIKSIQLQLDEVRITGREPLGEISSPLVSGRDFVTERLRIEASVPETALELERARLRETEKRLSLGVAQALDVEASKVRTSDLEAAVEGFRRKVELRRMYLRGQIDGVETELRALEADAEQRLKALERKLALTRKQTERVRSKVQVGTGERLDLLEAELRQQVLETEVTKADLELALVRRQLEQHAGKR
jgi:outer membrane protein TolC